MIAPPHDALLWQHEKKKKNHAAENFFPPPGKRKQLSEIWSFGSHVCKKPHDWFCFYTFFFFFFFCFPHCNFWALCEPSLCNLRLKTAAIRWQLWTFHLSAISRRSESSVCLSKLFSVFNLSCFSVFSLSSTPRCSPFLSPRFDSRRCERFWWEECPQWLGCYCSPLSIFRSSKGRIEAAWRWRLRTN